MRKWKIAKIGLKRANAKNVKITPADFFQCIYTVHYLMYRWFTQCMIRTGISDDSRTELLTKFSVARTVVFNLNPMIKVWFALWFTLWSLTGWRCDQQGLGLSGLIHEEAHPVVPDITQSRFKSIDAGCLHRYLVQQIPPFDILFWEKNTWLHPLCTGSLPVCMYAP